jgi:hypothetical protein
MYSVEGNITIGPILFADGNLNPLVIERADDLHLIIILVNQYTKVSGLNINIRKTTALCINAPIRVTQGLNQLGIETPQTCEHLGLYKRKNIENTIENTMRNTEPKRIKRRILGTTPPDGPSAQSTSYQQCSFSYLHSHFYGLTSPKRTNGK